MRSIFSVYLQQKNSPICTYISTQYIKIGILRLQKHIPVPYSKRNGDIFIVSSSLQRTYSRCIRTVWDLPRAFLPWCGQGCNNHCRSSDARSFWWNIRCTCLLFLCSFKINSVRFITDKLRIFIISGIYLFILEKLSFGNCSKPLSHSEKLTYTASQSNYSAAVQFPWYGMLFQEGRRAQAVRCDYPSICLA